MTLSEKIKQDFLSAMKNKELKKKNLIGLVKSEIDLIQKERSVTDGDVIKIIKKLLNGIIETLKIKQSEELIIEKELLEKYLPIELSEKEITDILDKLFKNEKNIGIIMKHFKDNYDGKVDNKKLMDLIKSR